MPYSENIARRIEEAISGWEHIEMKKMFGGVCYLLKGNMACGVYRDYLILRIGEERCEDALQKSHTRPFDITGKAMKGWVMVEGAGIADRKALHAWLAMAREFVNTLPSKQK